MANEVGFRELFCRSAGCGEMFFICRPCYRGQAYCSEACRQKTRQHQRREANRRYRQDPEVLEDHRNRERERRQWLRDSGVVDQSSTIPCGGGSIWEPVAETKPEASPPEGLHGPSKPTWSKRFCRVICIRCGRVGTFTAFIRRE